VLGSSGVFEFSLINLLYAPGFRPSDNTAVTGL